MSQRIITAQSLILDGLVIASGIVVSGAVLSVVDTATGRHKHNPVARLIVAGVIVAGTAYAAKTILKRQPVV